MELGPVAAQEALELDVERRLERPRTPIDGLSKYRLALVELRAHPAVLGTLAGKHERDPRGGAKRLRGGRAVREARELLQHLRARARHEPRAGAGGRPAD